MGGVDGEQKKSEKAVEAGVIEVRGFNVDERQGIILSAAFRPSNTGNVRGAPTFSFMVVVGTVAYRSIHCRKSYFAFFEATSIWLSRTSSFECATKMFVEHLHCCCRVCM